MMFLDNHRYRLEMVRRERNTLRYAPSTVAHRESDHGCLSWAFRSAETITCNTGVICDAFIIVVTKDGELEKAVAVEMSHQNEVWHEGPASGEGLRAFIHSFISSLLRLGLHILILRP